MLTKISSFLFFLISSVDAHGRLFQPPGRSTAWRYDFSTPTNYNDHEIYCGGYSRQWSTNKGKCGPCGDPFDRPQPRDNENGGKYGRGVIVAKYREGQEIEIGVELTANHRGFFEFRICPLNAPLKIPETSECFEKFLLIQSNGKGSKYYVGEGSKKFYSKYMLPKGLTCTQCVLQWRYVAGNNWGKCPNGTGKVGCGNQEEFRSCSDIHITDESGLADDTTHYGTPPTQGIPEPSYAGHVTAIVIAVLLALIFALILLTSYYWTEGKIQRYVRKPKGDWLSRLPASILISNFKNSNLLSKFQKGPAEPPSKSSHSASTLNPVVATTSGIPPLAPPRRNRPRSQGSANGPRQTALSISPPVSVSINGVQVSPYSPPVGSPTEVPDLHVPNQSELRF